MIPRFQVGNFSIAKDSGTKNSVAPTATCDEVLKRMLNMRPQPHKKSKKFGNEPKNITESDIPSEISYGNYSPTHNSGKATDVDESKAPLYFQPP
jgi:hypothetical protein